MGKSHFCCLVVRICYHPRTEIFEPQSALPKKDLENLEKGSVRDLSNAYQVSIMRDL
ncbi:hypothetical protein MADA3029_270020 [Vibrio nigripulchritudo MADA3029]|uniref:Transposase n=1 Tax=Vibrio nigripulchritudo SOn1 TaxID=1238450 RepID=A0AAV2VUD6_9VIBR|nr:hypothetical protein VIBNIAM115_710026 [Vibrio nigripulchritudo AM115]CCN39965.1 hypothetical protein VIBNIFTn2_1180026 [Vibrio nigripulchritudo FTn2]CCN47584.1 hypothetical protein VIBNIMADA3020_420020 [Vibrio nigripulchritudo MADA3020]CCN58783.1 hypothetical protein MADA3029_270020 [Vibrio nigripulchritudo MADA3029]CCN71591.1 hypothetical protein VIBNISFn118_410011 [Vibrio nigripulchritudo SFn118]CCN78229.1 hypothetical protein VIBNISO65_490026 [Vibrio nigripulchritudo SO65]CCO48225.1 hy